jgi:hypothetical protein
MTGAALASVALGSAVQVALYLHHFGVSHRTDGFIAAFAVYTLVVVVAQILRTTAVPLLSGASPRLDGAAFAWAIVAIAVITVVAGVALAEPLASVVAASTGPAGRAVAADSLTVMAPAAGLQLLAAGLAVRGALSGRLVAVGLAYMTSAAAGLIAFVPLEGAAAERTLAWTTLVASTVAVGAMLVGVGVPSVSRRRTQSVAGAALMVLRSLPLPASFVVMYPISLALLPTAPAGDVTLFGLAFTACSYLAGFTGQGLSMVDAVELARLSASHVAQRMGLVSRAFRYSLLAAAPGFAVAALVGGPIVHALISNRSAHVSFARELLLLAPWMVATLGLWATLPAVLTQLMPTGERRLAAGVLGLIAIHVVATLVGRAIDGFDGVVVAMAVAPAVFTVVAVRSAIRGVGAALARSAMIVVGIAAVSFGVPYLGFSAVLSGRLAIGFASAAAGVLAYAGLAALAFPEAAKTVAALLPYRRARMG